MAEPFDFERLRIVPVMALDLFAARASRADVRLQDLPAADVNVQVGPRIHAAPGFVGDLGITESVLAVVCVVARRAPSLIRRSSRVLSAFRAAFPVERFHAVTVPRSPEEPR